MLVRPQSIAEQEAKKRKERRAFWYKVGQDFQDIGILLMIFGSIMLLLSLFF